jgi:histidine decarboxylase
VTTPQTDTTSLDVLAALDNPDLDVDRVLAGIRAVHDTSRAVSIGFPGATDVDHSPVLPFFAQLWNNVGDPWTDPGTAHTKALERAVIAWFADLVGLPADDRWGYVTGGGTEGNLAALHAARTRHPKTLTYYSAAAHYSIPKILHLLGMTGVCVRADGRGEMDYDHLAKLVKARGRRTAIVVATAGTTVTEAVDDTTRIDTVLRTNNVTQRYIHIDAALSGIPLALDGTLRLDHTASPAIRSITVSGHKFLGAPLACGIVLIRRGTTAPGARIAYTATVDSTISGSRTGQAALLLWHIIATHGHAGLRARATAARELAAYATTRLNEVGWPAWRHPHAFTVVFPTPPSTVTARWTLSTTDGTSHLICMPGVTREQIDAFTADLVTATTTPNPAPIRRRLPRQCLPPSPIPVPTG